MFRLMAQWRPYQYLNAILMSFKLIYLSEATLRITGLISAIFKFTLSRKMHLDVGLSSPKYVASLLVGVLIP